MCSKVLIALAIVTAPAVYAQSGSSFPLVGIGSGQSVRLNVVNLAATNPMSPSTCGIELQFLDVSGKQLKQTSLQVSPGQTVSRHLRPSDLPGEARRAEVRAVVPVGGNGGAAPPTTPPLDCGSLFPSLEVYDHETGKTTLLITNTRDLPPPFFRPQ